MRVLGATILALVSGSECPGKQFTPAAPPPESSGAKPPSDSRALTPAAFERVQGPSYDGVIVPASAEDHYGKTHAAGKKITGCWTPDRAAIARLEAALPAFLEKVKPERSPGLHAKVPRYKRQYAGFLAGGRKIFVSFFCHEIDGWQTRPVLVRDGGDCFFQVVFDAETGALSDLMVNGES